MPCQRHPPWFHRLVDIGWFPYLVAAVTLQAAFWGLGLLSHASWRLGMVALAWVAWMGLTFWAFLPEVYHPPDLQASFIRREPVGRSEEVPAQHMKANQASRGLREDENAVGAINFAIGALIAVLAVTLILNALPHMGLAITDAKANASLAPIAGLFDLVLLAAGFGVVVAVVVMFLQHAGINVGGFGKK